MTVANDATISLTTAIEDVKGVGARRGSAFRKLGIRCVADLIRHVPSRYETLLPEQTLAEVGESIGPFDREQVNVSARGEIATCRMRRGRRTRFEATLEDGTATALLTWFNAGWMSGKMHPGDRIRVTGKAKRYGDYIQFVNPQWEPLPAEPPAAPPAPADDADEEGDAAAESQREDDGRIAEPCERPVYPATEDLPSRIIERVIAGVLDRAIALIDDHLHASYRRDRALPTLAEAYRMVHRPKDADEAAAGRRRLAFDELLMLQLGVMLKRHHRHEMLHAPPLATGEAIDAHIRARFPFTLTEGQEGAIAEIVADVSQTKPMNRLLQGDVGAGKTVVALHAMLLAVASKHQAAMMAPTELLAEQHFRSLSKLLDGSNVRLELLTGSVAPRNRAALLEDLAGGSVDIIVGTHALLTEHVQFASLGMAVIDEQHRFGVHQRAGLRAKATDAESSPHVLVMTATPIPRTLSLTIFGDLDNSIIRDRPPGRQTIITRAVSGSERPTVYDFVSERLSQGDQAYIVVPVIDPGDGDLTDLTTHLEHLREGPLRGRTIEALHGRMDRLEREAVMARFSAGETQALVATTVIEVGVDVPNATIMVIADADRFGLAQLHQLRGRVGRGEKQSLCVLIADPRTEDGQARVNALVETDDGFVIAERDLEIRGPGELFGSRQSGLPPFHVAELPRDMDLLRLARDDAAAWLREFPLLAGERDELLKKRLLKQYGESLGLVDVA